MNLRCALRRAVFAAACAVLFLSAPLRAAKWAALDPAELAATAPTVEPEAGLEVLAAETEVDDSGTDQMVTNTYYRIKVFTAAGVDKVAKIQINYDRRSTRVDRIEARTVKPDGTVLELGSKDIFEREIVRAGNQRTQAKSFAPPGLEPGVILEYRYRISSDRRTGFFPFLFEGDMPTRSVVYRFRPFGLMPGLHVRTLYMNYPKQELKPDKQGYYVFSRQNVRARKPEPMAPPALHVWCSVLMYYVFEAPMAPEVYWARQSRQLDAQTTSATKPTKELIAQAKKLVQPTDSLDEMLRKLHDYCRGEIVNRDRDGSGLTREQRRKMKANPTAADTLKSGQGSAAEINILFVALARAAGLDARLAQANDRSQFMFQESLPVPFMLNRLVGAVNRGESWTFCDPGAGYLPVGMLDWRNTDTAVIIADPKQKLIKRVEGARGDRSVRRQIANLVLAEDGTLEGEVTWEYTGHYEAAAKNSLDAATPDELERYIKGELEAHLKGAEISGVVARNANRPLEPLQITFRLRVPEFAERTGSRLFVQPAVFRRGGKALFESTTREEPVIFPHRYREEDDVTITLPEGFFIEAGSAPAGIDFGAGGRYQVEIQWAAGRRVIHYQREMLFNGIGFSVEHYPAAKRMFEMVHERDNHTLTFRQAPAGATP